MAISIMGKQYICANFGDASQCCINAGVSWYYTVAGSNTNETGGTAQIVSRLASGLIESLTMTSPARGTFTQAELNTANGSAVTLTDAQEITAHDEATEAQWCFVPCSAHTDQNTCENIYMCYWWNGSCHADPPACGTVNNQSDCLRYGCHWWNNSCHADPPTCEQLSTQSECVATGCYWYNGSCHSSIVCSSISTQSECESHGCHWYNGACHSNPPACSEITTQSECLLWGCYWYNGSCHSSIVCSAISSEAECVSHSCYWWNGTCHSSPPTCAELNNSEDCLQYGCYWYRGVCHSQNQPELCYYIDQHGGPAGLTIADIFEIIDSFLFSTPPTGWSFIPTLTNVFGCIDYFLGFDGDALTGCNMI